MFVAESTISSLKRWGDFRHPTEMIVAIPAGGTGTGFATERGIVGMSGARVLRDQEYPLEITETPPYLRNGAIKNKQFYKFLCQILEEPVYIGLSENLTQEDLDNIVERIREDNLNIPRPPKVIILPTGTDAMEQVAKYIDKKLGKEIREKGIKVILTGANRDLSKPNTDIWENLEFAVESGLREDIIPGVYVAFHERLIPVDLVVKEPFNGDEMNYISKRHPKYWLAKAKAGAKDAYYISKLAFSLGIHTSAPHKVMHYPVNVIRPNHEKFLKAVKLHCPNTVIFEGYHSSTANTLENRPEMSVAKLGADLATDGVAVFFVTETGEPVILTAEAYETSCKIGKAGVKGLGNTSKNVAYAKAMLCAKGNKTDIESTMTTNIAGELDENTLKY